MADDVDVFTIRATRCKRCGGILLSDYGLKNGMGHVCKSKYDAEHSVDENQMTFYKEDNSNGEPVSSYKK